VKEQIFAENSMMLMAMLMEKNPEGEIVGRDAQSAFNTLRRDHTAKILEGQGWLKEWIDDWLTPKKFDIEVDGKILGIREAHRQHYSRFICQVWSGAQREDCKREPGAGSYEGRDERAIGHRPS